MTAPTDTPGRAPTRGTWVLLLLALAAGAAGDRLWLWAAAGGLARPGATVAASAASAAAMVATPAPDAASSSAAAADPYPVAPTGHEPLPQRVQMLEARVGAGSRSADDLVTLARSRAALGRFDEAVGPFREALAQRPHDPQLMADLAEALANTHGRHLDAEGTALVDQALAVDPANLKALFLASQQAVRTHHDAQAAELLQRALAAVPDNSPDLARYIRAQRDDARRRAGLPAVEGGAAEAGGRASGAS